MRFKEAFEYYEEGHKIRSTVWHKDCYISKEDGWNVVPDGLQCCDIHSIWEVKDKEVDRMQEEQHKWISVKDYHPDYGLYVLVTDGRFVAGASWRPEKVWAVVWTPQDRVELPDVSHWMYIPRPSYQCEDRR